MHMDVLNMRSAPLALEPGAARGLFGELDDLSPRALEAYRATRADLGERVGRRADVGILYVTGPLLKADSWLSKTLGFTTYMGLRRDLQAALDDPAVRSICLYVDSPGGEASGCDELAKAIFDARQRKPITAFVSGMACSGGYWIASAAKRVVVSDAAMLGSIGVAMAVRPKSGSTMEFVSSQSPGKRADPTTDAGKARIQAMVDDIATVFIKAVAVHRGVSVEAVIRNFGEGGVKVGAKAVAAGMADSVGQFEATLAGMKGGTTPARTMVAASAPAETITVAEKPAGRTLTAAEIAYAKAYVAAEERANAIMGSPEGRANPDRAEHYALKTAKTVDEARAAMRQDAADASWKRTINERDQIDRHNAGR